jgi:hypothetical protein
VHELGRAKEPGTGDKESDRKGRRREKDSAEGGGRYLWLSRKRRGSCARAFPDPGAAKPGGGQHRNPDYIFNFYFYYFNLRA